MWQNCVGALPNLPKSHFSPPAEDSWGIPFLGGEGGTVIVL